MIFLRAMDAITKGFIIAACSCIIGWAGITAYNHYDTQRKSEAMRTCLKDKDYLLNKSVAEGARSSGLSTSAYELDKVAKEYLDQCLAKHGYAFKE
jgi:hypothetical protein